jgi:hypothetical protein
VTEKFGRDKGKQEFKKYVKRGIYSIRSLL